jgi:hypothetical protein
MAVPTSLALLVLGTFLPHHLQVSCSWKDVCAKVVRQKSELLIDDLSSTWLSLSK